jgi:hypothetical protein
MGLRDFEKAQFAYSGENPRGIRFCILYVQHRGIAAPIFGVRDCGAKEIIIENSMNCVAEFFFGRE